MSNLFYAWEFSGPGLEAAPVVEAPFIWSPNDRQARAARLHDAMLVFQEDMSRAKSKHPRLSDADFNAQLEAWRVFRDRWAKWYGSPTATTWLFGSVDTLLEDYEKQLAGWRQWYLDNIGTPAGQGPTVTQNSPLIPAAVTVHSPDLKDTNDWIWWASAAAGVAVIGGGIYYMRKRRGF